jgi:uncharacterized protein
MKLRSHRLPRDVFVALSTGSGGAHAVRRLTAAQYSKHVLLIRGVVDLTRRTGHPRAARVREAYDLLAAVQRRDPETADAVLRHPAVGAWARRAVRGLTGLPGLTAEPAGLCAVAAAAAIRSGTPCAIEVPSAQGLVTLPSLGQADLSAGPAPDGGTGVEDGSAGVADGREGAGVALVRCTGAGAEITAGEVRVAIPADPYPDGPGWRGLRRLTTAAEGLVTGFLIDDLDPYRMPGAMLADRLTPAQVATWQSTLDTAWRLLARHHRAVAGEVMTALTTLTPLLPPDTGTRSATSKEAFGTAAMNTPADGLIMATTFAHEIQHTKLAGVMDLVTLTLPDDGQLFYAPWRDDPRPIGGLLHGAYAHLGVAGFWRRQRHRENGDAALRAHAEFAHWRTASLTVAELLAASGRLTTDGGDFVAGMLTTLRGWETEDVPEPAMALARSDAERHRDDWRNRNAPG